MLVRVVEQEIRDLTTYRRFIEELLGDIQRQDAETIRRVIELLHQARMRIAQELATAEGWDLYHLQNLQAIVARALWNFEERAYVAMAEAEARNYDRGSSLIEGPLVRMGYRVPFADLSPYQLMIIQAYSADLIHGLVGDALSKINATLTLNILGEKSVLQAMQEITDILGEKRLEAIGGIGYRAERIVQTELGRIRSMATFARLKDAGKVIPGLMKEWISALLPGRTRPAHWAAHGQKVPVNKPFIVMGEKMMYPRDPAGSAANVINCICDIVAYHPDWEISVRREQLPTGEFAILRR